MMGMDRVRWALVLAVLIVHFLTLVYLDNSDPNVEPSRLKCTYPVSHDRQGPWAKYHIYGVYDDSATKQTCFEYCNKDVRCRSVTYVIRKSGTRYCNKFNITVQELKDKGGGHIFNYPDTDRSPTYITYDKDCVCASGHYANKSVCEACQQHHYKPGPGNRTSCDHCGVGTGTSGTGHPYCDICVEGFGRVTSSTSSPNIICAECTGEEYSDEKSNHTCKHCGTGALGSGTNGNTECVCASGHYADKSVCAPCQQHHYKPGPGNRTCHDCYVGTGTSGTGYAYCDICVEGFGRVTSSSSSSNIICAKCAGDEQYSDEKSNHTCKHCGTGARGSGTNGYTECVCKPGFEPDNHLCAKCKQHHFKAERGNRTCVSCASIYPGSLTSGTGQNNCDLCRKGYGKTQDLNKCERCNSNTYSANDGDNKCINCPANSITLGDDRVSCVCMPGYQRIGQQCDAWPPKFFKPTPGETACLSCTSANTIASVSCPEEESSLSTIGLILICVGLFLVALVCIVSVVVSLWYRNKKKVKKQHQAELAQSESRLAQSQSQLTQMHSQLVQSQTHISRFLKRQERSLSRAAYDSGGQYDDSTTTQSKTLDYGSYSCSSSSSSL